MIRNAQFNQEKSLIKILPNFLVTFYFAMLVYTSITNEGLQTNLVSCHLFPVIMTSFNTAASLLLERLINMHLTICHTLFKTNCHISFNSWVKNLPLAPRRKTPGPLYHTFNDFLACISKH